MEKEILLSVNNLKKSYGDKQILNDLSFDIKKGEIVGLLGHNGAGKTTAFYITIGLIKPDQGTILFQNNDITQLPIHKRASAGIGYLSQEPSIFRSLTVEENLLCILETLDLDKKEKKKTIRKTFRRDAPHHLCKNKSLLTLRWRKAARRSGTCPH